MKDELISRQAAIEIIQSMYPGMPRLHWMLKDWKKRYEPYIRIENAIRELPSAQQWIICSKRLPFLFPIAEYGESKSVLACLEDGTMNVLYFDGGNWCYPTGEPYIGINHENGWHNRVVAWMPLPEPYKEKNDE